MSPTLRLSVPATGWLYLAIVLDLYSRKVVGWAMAPGMCAALEMAIQQRRPASGLIVHSDRGSQYASDLYQALLAKHGFVYSMSRKGNCRESKHCFDAVVERFFLNLKMERIWQRNYANQGEAKMDIVSYIVGFYNTERLNSVLGNLPPSVFERNMAANKPIAMSEFT